MSLIFIPFFVPMWGVFSLVVLALFLLSAVAYLNLKVDNLEEAAQELEKVKSRD